jgi:hypothetical protein
MLKLAEFLAQMSALILPSGNSASVTILEVFMNDVTQWEGRRVLADKTQCHKENVSATQKGWWVQKFNYI